MTLVKKMKLINQLGLKCNRYSLPMPYKCDKHTKTTINNAKYAKKPINTYTYIATGFLMSLFPNDFMKLDSKGF